MRIINKDEFLYKTGFSDAIMKGTVFVYPTDTIYGIGCNALDNKAVLRIREIKQRSASPFSVIAPSKAWIRANCKLTQEAEAWIKKLPGPYTLILQLKNRSSVAKEVIQENTALGVRIPDHWISKVVEELGIPIVTTSVNKSGSAPIASIEDMDPEIKKAVDFAIDEGKKTGRPSTIVHLEEGAAIIQKR